MQYSEQERIGHVVRRLSVGAHGSLLHAFSSTDDAIADALDLTGPAAPLPDFPIPDDADDARAREVLAEMIAGWVEAMRWPDQRLLERLTWFWHDHFAVSARKVPFHNLMWGHLLTLRSHATARFDDLLRAMATDPAMLLYLDGANNHIDAVNENYAREVMELHTLGTGNYTQADVAEAARALTGWVVAVPGRRSLPDRVEPWSSVFVHQRHDDGAKTFLGVEGRHTLDDVISILLDQPATPRFVAAKLHQHLVGLPPDATEVDRLAGALARDWQILDLVEAIVGGPAFVSDDAIRSKVRSPLERLVSIAQGFRPPDEALPSDTAIALARLGYIPLAPPNPAGHPEGAVLMGPYELTHALDLLAAIPDAPEVSVEEAFAGLGISDVTRATQLTVEAAAPADRVPLAASSPEFALT
ncbi:MAG: DUF1800 family protein [Acidimicrobiia bacterium]|nr:DUF1800 family protein [Acidimicrobiia bacterium]